MSPIQQPIVFKMGIARTGFRPGENQLAIRRPYKAGRIVPMLVVSGQLNGGREVRFRSTTEVYSSFTT